MFAKLDIVTKIAKASIKITMISNVKINSPSYADVCNRTKEIPNSVDIVDVTDAVEVEVDDEVTEPKSCEIALSIQHIAHKIFTPLSTKDVLNCRLVSYSWKIFCTPFLQPRMSKININTFHSSSASRSIQLQQPKLRRNKSIQELIILLNQVDPPGTFPCTKFHLRGDLIFDENLKIFLTIYGIYIDDLSLTFFQDPRKMAENQFVDLLEQIKIILTKKAPNIKSFSLISHLISTTSAESTENSKTFSDISPLELLHDQNDSEFQTIEQKKVQLETPFQTKLKFLELKLNTNDATWIETLVQSSPDLQELVLDAKHCDFYISPTNRLHLLKRLLYNPTEGRLDNLERLSSFAINLKEEQEQEENRSNSKLLLRELNLDFEDDRWRPKLSGRVNFERKLARVLHDIIQLSASSLETISWSGLIIALVACNKRIQFPDVMPRMHSIKLMNPNFSDDFYKQSYEYGLLRFFHNGFSYANTFPNLRYVYLHSTLWNSLSLFLTFLNFDPMPSVEKVEIDWGNGESILEENLECIRKMFPNATVLNLK